MKIKTILLIVLITSTLPLTSYAWGKKKKDAAPHPENAWAILLATNKQDATSAPQTEQQPTEETDKNRNPLGDVYGRSVSATPKAEAPIKQHKTAPQQFAIAHSCLTNADQARADKDFVSAIGLYDKAIKAYITLQEEYPDWQPTVIKFRLNHCTYHLTTLLKDADTGKIKLDTSARPRKSEPSQQEKSYTLTKAKQLLMENKNKEARDVLIQTLITDPDNKRVRLMIGIVQCRLKQYHDATYLLETLIEEFPNDANAHVILATAYFGLNRYKDVIHQLNKALEINSFHQQANFNMAKILFKTMPDDTELIAKYYIKAVELGALRDPKLDAAILGQ